MTRVAGVQGHMGRVLWGVPLEPDGFVVDPALQARFEGWLAGSSLLLIDAATGYGKTAALAGWLRRREGELPVLWISCGILVTSPAEVWSTLLAGLVDAGLVVPEAIPEGVSDAEAFVAMQALREPIVVVYDDVDALDPPIDLDRLTRVARQVPLVRSVVIRSGADRRELDDSLRIDADALAWDSSMVKSAARKLFGERPKHIPYQAVTDATGGRPGAVLHYLSAAGGAGEGSGGLEGRTPWDVVLDWSLRNLSRADDGGLRLRVLSIIAMSIRMPARLLALLLPGEELEAAVDALIGESLITVKHDAVSAEPSYGVASGERTTLEAYGATVLGERVGDLHRVAAEYHEGEPALAIHHLARAQSHERAAEIMKRSWPTVGADVPLEDFRTAIAAISDVQYRRDLEALAVRVLSARLPPAQVVRRRDLETYLINASPARLREIPLERRALVTAASLWALITRGRVRDAIALGSRAAEQVEAAGWEGRAVVGNELPALWNMTAEAYLLAGLPRQALVFLRRAMDVMAARDNTFSHYQTTALAALAYALGGEFDIAAGLADQSRRIAVQGAMPASIAEYPLVVADALVGHATLDVEVMRRAAAWFESMSVDDPRLRSAARLTEAYALLFLGEADKALAMTRRILHGAMSTTATELGTTVARSLKAEALIALGKPGRAIEDLQDIPSPPGHAVCTAIQLASARLAMGRPRLALHDTDACIEQGADHSLRTLPAVLLRRAVAHEMLDHGGAADDNFVEAFLLLRGSSVIAPYLNLPSGPVEHLFARLSAAHPEYSDDAALLLATLTDRGILLLPDRVHGALSERELRVLGLLATGLTVPEMAGALFVSGNTVKTQISSIYRKLGVSSRAEATDAAMAMGLASES